LYSEFSSKVNAVVDWFGPLSFLEMDDQFADAGVTPKMGKTSSAGSPESQYIGGNIVDNADLVKKANPNTYITGDDPSFFIQHGNQDQNVPVQQSIDFAKNLSTVLNQNTVTIEILEGAGHGGDQFDAQANLDKVFSFLSSTLK
jgi:dipeptidyl aminopeptidase/acylaminoacyl peptidase